MDMGGNDLSRYEVSVGKTSAQLLVIMRSLLNELPACLMTQVVILEQHLHNRVV